jgi:hypothetical protein
MCPSSVVCMPHEQRDGGVEMWDAVPIHDGIELAEWKRRSYRHPWIALTDAEDISGAVQ